jgi:TetR/AcrR family transcriptional regulator, cholesterol catabolism regulator
VVRRSAQATVRIRPRPASTPRRDAVLAVAAEIFAEKGFRATTVRDIADAAGVLSGSLYHHFDSKESMVDELLGSFLDDLLIRYRGIAEAGDPPRRSLERLVEESFDTLPRHRAAIVVFQQEGDSLAKFERFHYIAAAGAEVERIWIDVIERGVAEGELATDNPKLTYHFLRDAIWMSVRWFRLGGAWTTRDLSRHFLRTVLDGLAPRP